MSFILSLLLKLPFFVGHIKIQFPKPLSIKEEKELVAKMEEGDIQAKNKLIEHNMRLVAHIAKKYSNNYDMDDLISIGSIGLVKAVNSFHADKSTHLATYASRCIENEILMFLRANKRQKNEISLYEPLGVDKEGNEVSLLDILPSKEKCVEDSAEVNVDMLKINEKMEKLLSRREAEIIRLRYGIGTAALTQREIAQKLNISRSYVSRIEKAALQKLR